MVNKWLIVFASVPIAALALGYLHKRYRKKLSKEDKKKENEGEVKKEVVDINIQFKEYLKSTAKGDIEFNFNESAKMLRNLSRLSDDDRLGLYGLFKQANEGDCSKQKPLLNLVEVKKWEAWMKIKGTSKHDAKQKYFQIIRAAVEKYQNVRDDDLEGEDPEGYDKGVKQGLGLRVSRLGGNLGMETAEKTEILMSKESTEFFSLIDEEKIEGLKGYIAKGFDLKQLNKAGVNPLHHAVDKEKVEVVKLLLGNSSDPNITDSSGLTALHYAVLVENKEIIEQLLAKKADCNIKDKEGQTPLEMAGKELREFMENMIKKYKN